MGVSDLVAFAFDKGWTGTAVENAITQEFMAVITESYEGEAFPQ